MCLFCTSMHLKNLLITGLMLALVVLYAFGQETSLKSLKKDYKNQDPQGCLKLSPANQKQIVLIRHGEPDLDKKGWRTRDEVIEFMKAYDSVGVVPFDVPPLCPESLATDTVYCSTLPRAAHTAALAFDGPALVVSEQFREFERKAMKGCNLRLPLKWRTTSARLFWFLGWNDKGIESFREARDRAKSNASFLVEKSRTNQNVILVAHGLHNRYVLKYLKKRGWEKVFDSGNGYLSVKILVHVE